MITMLMSKININTSINHLTMLQENAQRMLLLEHSAYWPSIESVGIPTLGSVPMIVSNVC